MRFKKNILFIVSFLLILFELLLKYDYAANSRDAVFDFRAITYGPVIILSLFVIFITENYQHVFDYIKVRKKSNESCYLNLVLIFIKNTIFKLLIILALFIVFLICTNRSYYEAILLHFLGLYIGVIYIRSILSFVIKPRSITIILLSFFSLSIIIGNLFPNGILVFMSSCINPFDFAFYNLMIVCAIIYLILLISSYFIIKHINIIKKINFKAYYLIIIINILIFIVNAKGERASNDELLFFYSEKAYNSFFEYSLFNIFFYYMLLYNTCLMLFELKNGIYKFFQNRISDKKDLKRLIIINFHKKMLSSIILTLMLLLSLIVFNKYNDSFINISLSVLKLYVIIFISNYLLLIISNKVEEQILVITIVISIISLILSLFNLYILLAILLVIIVILGFKRELN